MAEILRFRNARGELVEVETVPAARLKNEPATVIDRVLTGHAVAITRHDKPKAVLVSYEDFRQLAAAREAPLGALTADFDGLLQTLQSPGAKKALAAAFESTPVEIGRSAVEAAGKPRVRAAAKRVTKRPPRGRAGR
jgi:antitoxin Phd